MGKLRLSSITISRFEMFVVPSRLLEDENIAPVARSLTLLSALGLVAAAVNAVVWMLILPHRPDRLAFPLLLIVTSGASLFLIRFGRVRLARDVFLAGTWVIVTIAMLSSGGTRAPIFGLYIMIVMVAGLLSGWRLALSYAMLTIVLSFLTAIADPNGTRFEPFATPMSAWLTQSTIVVIVTGAAYFVLRQSQQALQRAQEALVEREKMQQSLMESEERFRLISAVTSDYTFSKRLNVQGETENIMLTGAFEAITGYSQEEYLAAGGWRILLHPDDVAQDERDMAALGENRRVTTEVRIITKSGDVRWVRIHAHPVWDEQANRLARINGGVRDITESRLAEKALNDSQKRYRVISEMISDYAYAYAIHPDGSFTPFWITDDSFQRMTGYTWDEIGATFGLYHPEDADLARQHVSQTIQGNPMSGEYRVLTKSGDVRWLHIRRQLEWDEHGKRPICVYGAAQDITERKLAEQAILALNSELQTKASQLATLNEIAYGISAITDLASTLKRVLANLQATLPLDVFFVALFDSTTQIVSYPIMYDAGRYWEQEPGVISSSSWVAQVLQTGQPLIVNRTLEEIEADTNTRLGDVEQASASVLMAPLPIGNKNIGVISVQSYTLNQYDEKHIDLLAGAGYQIAIAVENARLYDSLQSELVERKRLEAELQEYANTLEQLVDERTNALRRAKEQLELILNTTTNALAFADSDGDILMTNPAFLAMFDDCARQYIEGILLAVADEKHTEAICDALLRVFYDNETQRIEAQITSHAGGELDIDLTLVPVNINNKDSRNGVLLSGHDITQLKEIERFKAQFVADAVHDLATPIAGLSTRLYLLQHDPKKLAEHVRALENQVQHLRNLLNDLRTLSRMDRGQIVLNMAQCNVNEVAQRVFDTYEPVAIDKQQRLILNTDPRLPAIRLDQRLIERVLVNLVSNAINYTPEQKEISITTAAEEETIVVSVIDQGMGIGAEDIPHIFERFYRTAEARETLSTGTGLGLAITKEIVEMHGGSVAVTSCPGRGSTFTARLPLLKI